MAEEWLRLPFKERIRRRRELERERMRKFLAGECVVLDVKEPIPPVHELDLEKIKRKREAIRTAHERCEKWLLDMEAALTDEELLKLGPLIRKGEVGYGDSIGRVLEKIKEVNPVVSDPLIMFLIRRE